MAGGWAPDGAEQAQIDANLDDALAAARQNLPSGESARESPNAASRFPKPAAVPCAACSCVLPAKKKRTNNSVFRLPTTGAAARTAS